MSGYPPQHGNEPYTNPAFSQQRQQGMNYDSPQSQGSQYDAPYHAPPETYGRTPLRHQQNYGQAGFESQPQSRALPGPPVIQEQHESEYPSQNRNEISPTRSRGMPVDDTISHASYGSHQHHHPQSRGFIPGDNGQGYHDQPPQMRQIHHNHSSQDTLQPSRVPPVAYGSERAPSAPPSMAGERPQGVHSSNSNRASSVNLGFYSDSPYQRYSTHWNPETSGLSSGDLSLQDMRRSSQDSDDEELNRGKRSGPLAGGIGGVFGKKVETGSTASGIGANSGLLASGVQNRNSSVPAGDSDWLQDQKKQSKKTKWIVGIAILIIVLLAAGGTAAGVILSRRNNNGGGGGSATSSVDPKEDKPDAPLVNSGTDSVKNLLNNPNLHKSFYGMDYTPLNAIYPECLKWPATQNNITKDIAVISQLTTRLRMYGNDCNQTEMVLEAIKLLDVDLKVWLGVYIDNNATTNARQLAQMYNILETYGQDPFLGVVIGNEALFRKEITEMALVQMLGQVRQNFTTLGYDKINITTSDLGSAWTYNLAAAVDTLMANVHPFFAGTTVGDAPGWTWLFTENNDVAIARQTTNNPNVIVSEVGWPSGGGTLLGSVAGIDELNQFVEDYVCGANANGTEYYWFVPFDEPWKEKFNEPGKEWETRWGLMDVNRNLKPGVTIPDCPSK
ncbi:hypothetical protein TWF569_011088 [Orbilia oligospora]|uniref:glucan endo-1,3-beta-D-glucosidase n=1 Tax=Orbilia oligospora TaxID=2813651 RepID=A0A7C8JKE9_ORBOL|nr:hypothetical protein TWF102_007985 [Orbilia oligospora]KAF3103364.1 hypothetical protein TWF706_004971 [Orbilia oligospora]KAF3108415.1 hypothetical protein TWF103_005499 [Orbilia oligospora]KAF3121766.1 hypothetical protein TWF703_001635 [Orbilia oligospora]KAF3131640.1 hypothetical protein TWF569_011088 [Orbilia oligospora]